MKQTVPLLEVENLHVGFAGGGVADVDAVEQVSFTIQPNQTLGLVGESGSGKSVTALSILQLLAPTAKHKNGSIKFMGEELLGAAAKRLQAIRGNEIAMIFQEPMTSLNPLHSIEKQIAEILDLHQNIRRNRARPVVLELLKKVGLPDAESRLSALPHELSGGQRQRVMIAMALANRPKLLIADEPTTALDVTVQKQILELLKDIQQETGMSLLLISHDLGVVKYMADQVCVMKNGHIVEAGQPGTLFTHPQHDYTKSLVEAEPTGSPSPPPAPDTPPLLTGKNMRVLFPVKKNLFGRATDFIRAVDDVSLSLAPGETLGIVGESGSGKTTLGRALLRLLGSEGNIVFAGTALHELNSAALRPLRRDMQIVFQDPYGALSPRMSVRQIITEGLHLHEPGLDEFSVTARLQHVLDDVGLDIGIADRYPHEFSGGQRQRIAIARAMILNPQLVVLDEPTSALDRSVQAQIVDLLRDLQNRRKLAYIFISHDLKVVRALAHRVMVMKDGKLVEEGASEDIFTRPGSPYTRQLIDAAFEL